jgi:hypothetical protein
MRFQFTGGGTGDDDRIDLDQITVTVSSGGAASWAVPMLDDGGHGDGAAGDHVYGAEIPALATGTTVSYYVSATDDLGLTSLDPLSAPATGYSYTVGQSGPPPVSDGRLTGSAALFSRSATVSGQIDVAYDASTCAGERAIVLYGALGNFAGYEGCAQSDAGHAGTTSLDASALGNAWFNVVWTIGSTAGHPGYGSDGTVETERSWNATGLCSVAADDHSRRACP